MSPMKFRFLAETGDQLTKPSSFPYNPERKFPVRKTYLHVN
jgi:hypothetical protein